jgi:hypothetical protein
VYSRVENPVSIPLYVILFVTTYALSPEVFIIITLEISRFKVCKSVHHHTIQINQTTKCNNFSSLLLDVYVQLNMFRASSRPSSGAQQLQYQPLVLPLERGGSSAVGRPTALLPPRSNGKIKGCYCSC